MSTLRERRHRDTRVAVVDTALRLFEADSYSAVTVERIAAEAGVSRRTLYRHFPTKDRILLDLPLEWVEEWDAIVADSPTQWSARQVIEATTRRLATLADTDPDTMRLAWRIVAAAPELEIAFLANQQWSSRLLAIVSDPRRGAPVVGRAAAVRVGAFLGALDAAMADWASGSGRESVATIVDEVLAVVGSLFAPPD